MDRDALVDRSWALLVAVAAAGAGILTALALTFAAVLGLSVLGVDLGVVLQVVLTLVLTAGVGFGGVSVAYVVILGLDRSFLGVRVPTVADLAWVGGGYLLAMSALVVASVVVGLVGAEAAPNQISELGLEHPTLLLLLVPASLLLIGPGEELLFRGVVQGTLRRAFGPVGAVVLASAIFAAVHYVALTGGVGPRLTSVAVLFLPSLVLGAAYERTGNLVVPALIHGLYNSTIVVLLYLGLRYSSAGPAAFGLLG